jgi:hypothetical protein
MFAAPAPPPNPGAVVEEIEREGTALAPSPARPVWPRCDGRKPIEAPRGVNGISPRALLPRWSWEVDPRLQLAATAKTLELTSDLALNFSRPQEQLFFRLWINDRPFVPSEAMKDGFHAQAKQATASTKKLHVRLEFDPALFGAKKGDRVAIQLLYCPDGGKVIRDAGRRDAEKQAELHDGARPRLPLLTPKAEFVVR